ncbi:hypothetical protein Tco_0119486, partial [Tanacetum coccineum]
GTNLVALWPLQSSVLPQTKKFNFSKYIFNNMVKNLEGGVKFLMYPRFVKVLLDKQVEGMSKHKEIYVIPSHTKKVFANMKRQGKDFSSRDKPLFPTMTIQAQEQLGEVLEIPTDSHHTTTTTQPLTSKPQKKQSRRKQRKDTEDPQLRRNTLEIDSLKKRVKKLEKKKGSRNHKLIRLYKVGRSVTLVDETQGRYGDNLMFDTGVLDNEQDMAEKEIDMAKKDVSTTDPITTTGEVVTTANVIVSTAE